MGAGNGAIDFGGGFATGLASAFGEKRAHDRDLERDRENRNAVIGRDVLGYLIQSGRIAEYGDLMPYVDLALGSPSGGAKGKKPKKGDLDPHEIMQFALGPMLQAQAGGASGAPAAGSPPGATAPAPVGGDPLATPGAPAASPRPETSDRGVNQSIVKAMGASATVSGQPPVSQATTGGAPPVPGPAPQGAPTGQPGATGQPGIRLLSDAEMIERETSNAALKAKGIATAQAKLARDFYEQFKAIDPDFTLYDALAMAGMKTDFNRQYSTGAGGMLRGLDAHLAKLEAEKGSPLTSEEELAGRAAWFAQNRSGGVNREALARAKYGKAFVQLSETEAADIIKSETALLGQQSYSRTAGGNQADFNAPITPTQAQTAQLPVGTTGPQVAGQLVLKPEQIEARKSTESLVTQLQHIKADLLGALPKKGELGELAPGAALALRRRHPQYRDQVAALEAAVNNIVNVVARTVGQQRGTQTERDAMRAEAAIVALKDAVLTGDTQESAAIRIDETLRVITDVLGKMPSQAQPQTGGAAGTGTAPAATPDSGRRARARAALVGAGKLADDATITKFLQLNPNFK